MVPIYGAGGSPILGRKRRPMRQRQPIGNSRIVNRQERFLLRQEASACAKDILNLLDGSTQAIARLAEPSCPVCGKHGFPTRAEPEPVAGSAAVISPEDLVALGPVQIVMLLEEGEGLAQANTPAGSLAVSFGDLVRIRELTAQGPVVLTCRHGFRSAALARLLRSEGLKLVYALAGGSWAIRRDL